MSIVKQFFAAVLPSYGDGLTNQEAAIEATSVEVTANNIHDLIVAFPAFSKLILLVADLGTGKPLNDRKFQIEQLVENLSALPATGSIGKLRDFLSNAFTGILWKGLAHPPECFVGENFRSSNGDDRSSVFLNLGRAGSPYARSVQPIFPRLSVLPKPGDIFDSLLARESFKPHPNGISANLFYFATLIIHDLFYTKRSAVEDADVAINLTTSYLDLSPLYGYDLEMQRKVRTMSLGKLKPDTFADSRLLLMVPGVGALIVMFSRNHNRIADTLRQVNEDGRFNYQPNMSTQELAALDEKLFRTARYINCCFYMNIILHDYLTTILGLNHTSSDWYIDPTRPIPGMLGGGPVPLGTGNQNSVEFNLIYRWHAAISQQDEEWINNEFISIFGEAPTVEDFVRKMGIWEHGLDADPAKWSFGGLKRASDGKFKDPELGKILSNGVDWIAGAFGPENIPKAMRIIEIFGISEARRWGVCTLNEFRKFIGCKVYATFIEINPDKKLADTLFKLYKHVDNVELYPGLLAEAAKPPIVGSGICLNYSASRAILFDAVALVRGDRLFTHGYNPFELTTWGYNECRGDPSVAQGGVLYKVLLSNLPGFYKRNSIYALFPFTTPETTRAVLSKKGQTDLYDFTAPKPTQPPTVVSNYAEIKRVLGEQHSFNVVYAPKMEALSQGYGFFLAWDDDERHNADRNGFRNALSEVDGFVKNLREFYRSTIRKVINDASYTLEGHTSSSRLDIVNNVCNVVPMHFASEYFCLSLKTQDSPHGIFTEQELYSQLATLFIFVFLDLDENQHLRLEAEALKCAKNITQAMTLLVDHPWLASLIEAISGGDFKLPIRGLAIAASLRNQGWTTKQIVANLFGCAVALTIQSQALSQTVEFYLRPENAKLLEHLQSLAVENTLEADEMILGYILEAGRLMSWVPGLLRQAATMASLEAQGKTVTLAQGDIVFLNLAGAQRDPVVFPNPDEVKFNRPKDKYLVFGDAIHECFGEQISKIALLTMLKEILKLKNLRRAPGFQGQLKTVELNNVRLFVTPYYSLSPLPSSMLVFHDGFSHS